MSSNVQNGDAIRAAFRARAIAVVEHLAEEVAEPELQAALAANTDVAVLGALGLMRAPATPQHAGAADPLAPARARGEQAKRDIIAAQGEMLDVAGVAARLGLSVGAVEARRQRGLLLALPLDDGTWAFPTWQLADHDLLPGLEDVFRAMSVRSPWMRAAFFLSGDLRLDGRTPLSMLRAGKTQAVRDAGAAYGEQIAS